MALPGVGPPERDDPPFMSLIGDDPATVSVTVAFPGMFRAEAASSFLSVRH